MVHDCQHRISNEIDWVSAGWFHYYGPRMDFSAFFLNGAVPGSFLDHLWHMLGSLQTKTNRFDHPVFTGRRSLETRGAPSSSSGRAETVSVSPPRAQTFRESFLHPPCFEILDSPPRNMRSNFVDADPGFDAHDTLPWDVTETTDDATWARWIEIYSCECDDTLSEGYCVDDSPRSKLLKKAMAGQMFAFSLYKPMRTPSTISLLQRARVFENMVVERGVPPEADAVTYFGPETLRDFLAAENQCVEQFCADLLQEEADVQVPASRNESVKTTKYGRCSKCETVLQPVCHRSGQHAGTPILRCKNWFTPLANGRRGCWFWKECTIPWNNLPQTVQRQIREVRGDIAWQLKHPNASTNW